MATIGHRLGSAAVGAPRGQRPGRRIPGVRQVAVLGLIALAASGCGMFGSGKKTSTNATPSARITLPVLPSTSAFSATPTPTVVATPTPTPTPTPKPSTTPSPSPKPSPKPTPTPSASPAGTVEITGGTGATQNVKLGQLLSLKLPQQSDAGYGWVFSKQPDAAILKVTTDQTLPFSRPPPAGTVGNNLHHWVFQPVAAGTTTFTVAENKTADATAPPVQTYALTVVVTP